MTFRTCSLLAAMLVVGALFPTVALAEQNDIAPGTSVAVGQTITDVVDANTDSTDFWAYTLEGGQAYRFDIVNNTSGSAFFQDWDFQLVVAGTGGDYLVESKSVDGADWEFRSITFTPAVTGTYSILIRSNLQSYTTTNLPYRITSTKTGSARRSTDIAEYYPGPGASGTVVNVVDGVTDPSDYYCVRLLAGTPVVLTLQNDTSGSSFYQDWRLRLRNVTGGILSEDEDYQIPYVDDWRGRRITYTPAVTGLYVVEVSSDRLDSWKLDAAVNSNLPYKLTLEGASSPGPTGAIAVAGGTASTISRSVAVNVVAGDLAGPVSKMMLSSDPTFWGATWIPYSSTGSVYLMGRGGTTTVYAKFMRADGTVGEQVAADSIYLDTRTFITPRASASTIRKGKTVTMQARLRDVATVSVVGKRLKFQRSYDRRHWKTLKTIGSSSGYYKVKIKPSKTAYYRWAWSGDSSWMGAKSATKRVRVRR